MPEPIVCPYAETLRAVAPNPQEAERAIGDCGQCVDGFRSMGSLTPCPLGETVELMLRGEGPAAGDVVAPPAGPVETVRRTQPPYSRFGSAATSRNARYNVGTEESGERDRYGALLDRIREFTRQSEVNLGGYRYVDLMDYAHRLARRVAETNQPDVTNLNNEEVSGSIYLLLSTIRRHPEALAGEPALSEEDRRQLAERFLPDVAALERAGLKGAPSLRRSVAIRHQPETILGLINEAGPTIATRACARNVRDPIGEYNNFMAWKQRAVERYEGRVTEGLPYRLYWYTQPGRHEQALRHYLNMYDTAASRILPFFPRDQRHELRKRLRGFCASNMENRAQFNAVLADLEHRAQYATEQVTDSVDFAVQIAFDSHAASVDIRQAVAYYRQLQAQSGNKNKIRSGLAEFFRRGAEDAQQEE